MKIVKYELSLVQKKELILTMEDNVDSESVEDFSGNTGERRKRTGRLDWNYC